MPQIRWKNSRQTLPQRLILGFGLVKRSGGRRGTESRHQRVGAIGHYTGAVRAECS